MTSEHLSDEDLDRYVMGLVHDDSEIKWIEEHLFRCPECAARMEGAQDRMDAVGE